MDGIFRCIIVNENLGVFNGLIIDYFFNCLYWIDVKLDWIEEFDLNSRNRRVIFFFIIDVFFFGLVMN